MELTRLLSDPAVFTFSLYLMFMLLIGLWMYRRNESLSDYVLGGRRLGSWLTALAAQASDMSAWLLMGLPGFAVASGFGSIWLVIGLAVGTFVNWKFVAKRLRVYTEKLNALTIPDYLEARFGDNWRVLRVFSALVIVVFFLLYTASGFVAGGKLMNQAFGFDYTTGLYVAALIIIAYTFLGGFLAVAWTDFFQGMLMFFALVIVPIAAIRSIGGFDAMVQTVGELKPENLVAFQATDGVGMALVGIISLMAWGLAYPGLPHVVTKFMAIRQPDMLRKSTVIAMVWVLVTMYAAVFVGMAGLAVYKGDVLGDAPKIDPETVFIKLSYLLFDPWVAGFLVAAIMAAIMSSVDSFLLVSSSALAEDFYKTFFRRSATEKELLWVGRIGVLLIAGIALVLAHSENQSVFSLVAYAWGGLGASLGPVILLSLYWKRMTREGALAGMLVGMFAAIVLHHIPAVTSYVYELLPAFFLSLLSVVVVSKLTREPSAEVQRVFEEVAQR
ncbi:sodium/proline symporter PutP [Calditerricola satsumensis]|uniref:Sodium/proline symporter n=1 Tax=Calditerricola satsumensis TaxID=373054 RepID=A0A8J3BCM4_9BACI|nr:sodium/proline symporter PutP [Calditerricola satsumensis]GGK04311.1 sodium:proline symporter [Calditerricola satsumensis]